MQAARLLKRKNPDLRFEMARAPGVADQTLRALTPPDLDVAVVPPGERYEFMRRAGLLLAASGTVTLESALIGTPTVVAYRLSGPTFLLGRMLVTVDHVSLPNLILQERVFPELLQQDARAEVLARHAAFWLDNEAERAGVRDKLARLRALMGEPGAPERAARIILDHLT